MKWLENQCKKWGTSAKFIYDWEKEEDLLHIASLKSFRAAGNSYNVYTRTCKYLDREIDSEQIMKDHNADNIIYIFFYNTPLKNTMTSYTYNYCDVSQYPYEFCNILTGCDGEEEAPAAYAHEILHTFGAPDLYYADPDGYNYGITQKYVNYLERTFSNDIMFTTFGAKNNKTYYTKITNKLTELDAYYVGLTKSSKVQKKIADCWDMKFFYTPEWGTCTAEKKYNGDWEVVLKGNISGYTDDYKDDFIYNKKFKAKVTVSPTGKVSYVSVSREY